MVLNKHGRNDYRQKSWLERKLHALEPWLAKRALKSIGRTNEPKIWDRYFIFRSNPLGVFLHKFVSSDLEQHCHPWANVTIPLTGPIIERHHDATETMLKPFRPYFRTARQLHQLIIPTSAPVFTLFIRFRREREWGFSTVIFRKARNIGSENALKGMFFPKVVNEDALKCDESAGHAA